MLELRMRPGFMALAAVELPAGHLGLTCKRKLSKAWHGLARSAGRGSTSPSYTTLLASSSPTVRRQPAVFRLASCGSLPRLPRSSLPSRLTPPHHLPGHRNGTVVRCAGGLPAGRQNNGGGAPLVVLGIDPDVGGAIAVLKLYLPASSPKKTGGLQGTSDPTESSPLPYSINVVDVPTYKMPSLKSTYQRRRHDAMAMAKLLSSLALPPGVLAVVEAPRPLPGDGKMSHMATGMGCGMWVGLLAAHGVNANQVAAATWKSDIGLSQLMKRLKKEGKLAVTRGKGAKPAGKNVTEEVVSLKTEEASVVTQDGVEPGNEAGKKAKATGQKLSNKDVSRAYARSMFPELAPFLTRKMDHGRAEAVLIAAYGARELEIYEVWKERVKAVEEALACIGGEEEEDGVQEDVG